MTDVADVRKGHTAMPYRGDHQTLTEQSMRYQISPVETCHTTMSESVITMLISVYKNLIFIILVVVVYMFLASVLPFSVISTYNYHGGGSCMSRPVCCTGAAICYYSHISTYNYHGSGSCMSILACSASAAICC